MKLLMVIIITGCFALFMFITTMGAIKRYESEQHELDSLRKENLELKALHP